VTNMKIPHFLLVIMIIIAISDIYATEIYTDYDPIFDTTQNIYLGYNITPSINSDDLDVWVNEQGSDSSWAYHIYQKSTDGSFRIETGYWVWKDNSTKFVVKLYGNTSEGDIKAISVAFPFLEMQANKTYNIGIGINGSKLELFVNGIKYNASGEMQIWYANGTFKWKPFKNGNISLGNFSLKSGEHGIEWNITGWDLQHLGGHPFEEFDITNATEYNPINPNNAPVRAPIPYGVIALSLITITILMRDDRWVRKR